MMTYNKSARLCALCTVVFSYATSSAMESEGHQDHKDRLRSSFRRAAQELKEEEEKMLSGKVAEYKESELEKELNKNKRKTKNIIEGFESDDL